MFKKKSIFKKIDDYLIKKGHELVFSIFLEKYNGNNIFVRFDYVRNLSVYKIIWVDLNFFDEHNMSEYMNMQMMTSTLANRLVDCLEKIDCESGNFYNDKIMGDRVEIISYQKETVQEYIFSRFLPLEWKFLIDPIVIVFSYLPRSMETFLNEMFAKYDKLEEKYNYLKPIKFNIFKDDLQTIFNKNIVSKEKEENLERVIFLEKVLDKYVAIVEGTKPYLVIIHQINEEFVLLWCNCDKNCYCKHIYSVIMAIRKEKFNSFYKVKYIGNKNKSLLDKISMGEFNLCFGADDKNLFLISSDGAIQAVPILDKAGKCVFEVIEDDDELSLSNTLKQYKK